MFAARAWGVGVGLLCVVMASCAPDTPAIPSHLTNAGAIASIPGSGTLTSPRMLRALVARSHVARNGMAPKENVVRRYDENGNVSAEFVKQGAKWTARGSTIPTEIASRSLASFVITNRPALMRDSIVRGTNTQRVYDSYHSITTTAYDTGTTKMTTGSFSLTRDSDDPTLRMTGVTYYASPPSAAGNVLTTTEGDVVMVNPEGGYLEFEIMGSDWRAAVAAFVADTAGSEHTQRVPYQPHTTPRSRVGQPSVSGVHSDPGSPSSVSTQYLPANCETSLEDAHKSAAKALIAGEASTAALGFVITAPAAPFLAALAAAYAADVALNYVQYLACIGFFG